MTKKVFILLVFLITGCGDLNLLERIKLGDDYYKLQLSPTEFEETLFKAQSGTYTEKRRALKHLKNTLFEFDTVEKRTRTLLTIEILNDIYASSNTEDLSKLKDLVIETMENIVSQAKKEVMTSNNSEIEENNILQEKIAGLENTINSSKSNDKKIDKP